MADEETVVNGIESPTDPTLTANASMKVIIFYCNSIICTLKHYNLYY